MSEGRKRRIRRGWLSLRRADRRLVARVLVVGVAAFLLGYAVTAVLFFRGTDRPDVVSVPDLRELNGELAGRRLEDLGLALQIGDSLPHPEVREGDIMAQSPLPGREVPPGTRVRVILSAGRPVREVPDVTALPPDAARRLLDANGFEVHVSEVPSPLPPGRVVAVVPGPGTPVRLPGMVQLQVSAGPPLVEVPALFGLSEEDARAALEAAGLVLGEIEYDFGLRELPDMVVDQSPPAGDSIPMGNEVRLRVMTSRSVDGPA